MGKLKPLVDAIKDSGDSAATHSRRLVDLPGNHKTKLDEVRNKTNDTDRAGASKAEADVSHTPGGGLPKSKIDEIVAIPKPHRPDPSTYKSKAEIEAHLKPFQESGAVRFTSRKAYEKYETIGPADGTYVVSMDEFKSIMARTKGDLSQVETILGLDPGTLGDADTMVVHIAPGDLDGLRMPDGNEAGANSHWLPGGVTSGGVPEATINAPKSLPFTEIHLGGKS